MLSEQGLLFWGNIISRINKEQDWILRELGHLSIKFIIVIHYNILCMWLIGIYIISIPPKLTRPYTVIDNLGIPQPNGFPHSRVLGPHVIHVYRPSLREIVQTALNHTIGTISRARVLSCIGRKIHFRAFIVLLRQEHAHILQQFHVWFRCRTFKFCSKRASPFRLLTFGVLLLLTRRFWL